MSGPVQWKPVNGYEGRYEVSSTGTVRNVRTGKEISQYTTKGGYLIVQLHGADGPKNHKVHRVVAKAFIPNPEGKPEVNHIDFDKKNNSDFNLEWVTAKENVRHFIQAIQAGVRSPPKVICVPRPEAEAIKEYWEKTGASHRRIASAFNVPKSTVWGIIKSHRASSGTNSRQALS